jgi:hypothetical protein
MEASAARILGTLYIALVTAAFTDEQRKGGERHGLSHGRTSFHAFY